MKVNLDFKFPDKEGEEKIQNQQAVFNILERGMVTLFPKGIRGSMQRKWARIQKKFDDAVEKNLDDVEFDSAELVLFEDILSKVEYPVGNSKHIQMIFESVESALKKDPEEVAETVKDADADTEAAPTPDEGAA